MNSRSSTPSQSSISGSEGEAGDSLDREADGVDDDPNKKKKKKQ